MNVLLIMQDQLRYDCAEGPLAATPTLDSLRADGTWFERAYTPIGICSPARASLFTGLYPHTHGVLNNVHGTDAVVRNLPRSFPSLGELVRDAGYRTGYIGKWHVGMDDGARERGFVDTGFGDKDFGKSDSRMQRYSEIWKGGLEGGVFTRYPDSAASFGRRPFPIYFKDPVPEDLVPARYTLDDSQQLLEQYAKGSDPFFLVCSFIEPHWPNLVPEPWASMYPSEDIKPWDNFEDLFEGKPRANQAGLEHFGVADFTWDDWAPTVARYLGATSFVDDLCGRLLKTLDELGLADDTLVISSADHGDMTGSHRQFNKGPLMYEEVYRIPFVVRGPGVPGGRTTKSFATLLDVMPTVLEAVGVPAPERRHGKSLWPMLRNETEGPDAIMCEFHGDEFGLYSQRMIRMDDYKLVYNPNDLRELYDLSSDPAEMHNLAYEPDYADVRRRLEVRLLELMHESEDSHRQWAVNVLA